MNLYYALAEDRMRENRRTFLMRLAASAAPLCSGIAPAIHIRGQDGLRGATAGEKRLVGDAPFCWCPPGQFLMGSPADERGRRADEAQVRVVLTQGFWAASHEVTQSQWRRVMGAFPDRPPSPEFGEGDAFPVYWVSFTEAESYCSTQTRQLHRSGTLPAGWRIELPTEAQWEYACRAGTLSATAFGEALRREQANFAPEAEDRAVRPRGGARPVGSYGPNGWGIHDMHGNVWEWCRDYYHARLPGGRDPDLSERPGMANRDGSVSRVRRGGAWIEPEWACRSACRLRYEPHRRSDHIGFRVFVVER